MQKPAVFKLSSEKDLNKQLRHKTKNTIKTAVGFYFLFPNQNQTKPDTLKPTRVLQRFSNNQTKPDKTRQNQTN